ncbi:MAG: NUDIX hydrolase [Pseudomonadota bacterium]
MTGPPDIETLSSTLVYENRWTRVYEDRIRRRDGSEGIYGWADKNNFVVVAAIEDGMIHMVEQYRYPVGKRIWELPQGGLQGRPEVPLDEVAHIELAEETGLRAASMERLGQIYPAYGFVNSFFQPFLATGLTPGETDREAEEQDMVHRAFALAEVLEMARGGTIQDGPTIATLGLLSLQGRI